MKQEQRKKLQQDNMFLYQKYYHDNIFQVQ
jgi:hypothetical protein